MNGSSPLTRGKQRSDISYKVGERLIPAHAGKTFSSMSSSVSSTAHPRSRGENLCPRAGRQDVCGSSPLTRGKLIADTHALRQVRLIPAHAGKTVTISVHGPIRKAHPRSRGENGGRVAGLRGARGSSPLTRGKLTHAGLARRERGLIPAHAGKTLPDMRFYCADRSDLGNP